MRRLLATTVVLVPLALVAQVPPPHDDDGDMPPPVRWWLRAAAALTDTSAFFEFAPTSGAGMGTACACAAVTGSRGETVTFTRTGSAMCLKQGLASTGIVNGDAVLCGGNLPRVEAQSDGVLGLLVEEARTNQLVRSQEFDNVVWNKINSGSSAPTVTADYGVAPDGTTTADRVQIAACPSVGNYSVLTQSYTGTAAAWSGQVFLKGTSGSGTVLLYLYDNTAAAGNGITCAYNSTSWTWCGGPAAPMTRTFANTAHVFGLGCVNLAAVVGSGDTGAADVLVWQAQSEAGAFPSSPIPTTSASATRNDDSAGSVTLSAGVGPAFCVASSAQFQSTAAYIGNPTYLGGGGTTDVGFWRTNNTQIGANIGGTSVGPTTVAAFGTTAVHRFFMSDVGAGPRTMSLDGVSLTAPANSMSGATTAFRFGRNAAGGNPLRGIVSRVQIDPDPTRCTP